MIKIQQIFLIYLLIHQLKEGIITYLNGLKKITKDFTNLKDLQNEESKLHNILLICNQKYKYCYYNCCLLKNNDKEHKCPYNHK